MSGGFSNKNSTGTPLTADELLWVQTGAAGVLLLDEQGSAPSATSGIGKVYVKSSDGNLYYLDDSGTETQLTGAGSGVTVTTPTGTVNGVNAIFTVTAQPKWVVSDGITYFNGAGYTYAALSITLDVPPSQYIRAMI